MLIIFSIIGLFILGNIVRGLLKDSTVGDKPKGASEWIVQIVISVIVGFVVWAIIPKNCNHHSSDDDTYIRYSRD